ncbi:zf-HC2 domain-containing protein [Anaerocolumna sp. MB42-C2]|uniref:zf-HC2 domain-containing protein n=1 Tax=Anaerocolumna sp. MB42-C2 TaxID=3070997 RepID=UPI0027E18189|nr:zf-HC2 domain-containing protein [Anaerocolumna sp. MB42-C2]WMJ89225.1 zf-HC2 domain-containing protein [Anaerocolumna sp. MB42-C2]
MNDESMKYDCQVIQDLLPLYRDDVCSDNSRRVVEEHLKECHNCSSIYEQLNNTVMDDKLYQEMSGVLEKHAKMERRHSVTVGITIGLILMIPVIVCLICNLVVGHALDWFFIVLATLLVVTSLVVVPLVTEHKKALWTCLSFSVSVILLLLVTCIYSRGDWFFLASVSTIFGLSVVLLPFLAGSISFPKSIRKQKGLFIMLWDTFWLYAVIVMCGFYISMPSYWKPAFEITSISVILPWILFLLIRYTKLTGLTKAGISLILFGVFAPIISDVINYVLYGVPNWTIPHADLLVWNNDTVNSNVYLLILVVFVTVGIVLLIAGEWNRHGKRH